VLGLPPEASIELIDIGANLTHKAFESDLDGVLQRARTAGVTTLIVTGTTTDASEQALALTKERAPLLYATAGVHPHDAKSFTDATVAQLRALASNPAVRALGECGLDYNRNFSPRDAQLRAFEAQLELAAELALPLFIHDREAHADLHTLLERYRDRIVGGVVHCFTGTREELRAYLDLDLHIGITGWICDERRGLTLRRLVSDIPSDRLMLETDAPYLLPRTLRPAPANRRNEPAFLTYVLAAVAECTGRPAPEIAAETTRTARAFFRI
jgi:TatD DNase family protein